MFRVVVLFSAILLSVLTVAPDQMVNSAMAQSVSDGATDSASSNGLMQEQAAICASYARIMEYSGLMEKTQGALWRERRFFAGAMLRSSINKTTGTQPTNGDIDGVISEYSAWMLDLFSANKVISDNEKLSEKDKLRDYISNFCTGLFNNADKAIAKVRPDLFAGQSTLTPATQDTANTASGEQVSRLLKENVRLQQSLLNLQGQLNDQNSRIAEQEKALAAQKTLAAPAENTAPSAETSMATTAIKKVKQNIIMGDVMDAPPKKPPLPVYISAQTGDVITPAPTKDLRDVGLTQIQLASYSTIKNANRGLNILSKELPQGPVELLVTAAKLASGRNVFRVVSTPISIIDAKEICTLYWKKKYACIIKMDPTS